MNAALRSLAGEVRKNPQPWARYLIVPIYGERTKYRWRVLDRGRDQRNRSRSGWQVARCHSKRQAEDLCERLLKESIKSRPRGKWIFPDAE